MATATIKNTSGTATSTDIKDRVKTFEDACAILGLPSGDLVNITSGVDALQGKLNRAAALIQLEIIIEALNEGWVPDWNDDNQRKHYPWFDLSNGFSFDCVGNCYRHSSVGSRLCFRTPELAEYAAKQFRLIYETLFSL